MIATILPTVLSIVGKTLDRSTLDKNEAERIKKELVITAMQMEQSEFTGAVDVLKTEIQGDSWLQRNWRPILMLVIIAIVANNYLLYPYLSLFWNSAPKLELPEDLWQLMKLGVGGYVGGRTVEKVAKTLSNKNADEKKNILGL